MPFKNAEQEKAMWANAPEVARKWFEKYGHAKGYVKKKKRRKKGARTRYSSR